MIDCAESLIDYTIYHNDFIFYNLSNGSGNQTHGRQREEEEAENIFEQIKNNKINNRDKFKNKIINIKKNK